MNTITFDIETNGLLDDATSVVCMGVKANNSPTEIFTKDQVFEGLNMIHTADVVVGHNIVAFDLPMLMRLYPNWPGPTGVCKDTMVMGRLEYPDIKEDDYKISAMPKELIGSHSLKAWGHRLNQPKGDYLEAMTDYSTLVYTKELGEYCANDVELTHKLYLHLLQRESSSDATCLEHLFALHIAVQQRNGFAFDMKKAAALYATLSGVRDGLFKELVEMVPPTETKTKTKTKLVPFNPGSRQQIAAALTRLHGWSPKEFTPSGEAKVDEAVLSTLEYPIAKKLSEYLMVQKRIGMLSEGDESWMKAVQRDGRIHGYVNHNGAITGRCTHRKPNLAQVTGVESPWGKECRELFVASPGNLLIGVDAQGLELRCLAHYLARWDGGDYGKELLGGDIHTANQKAAGLPTRADAKKFIYAWLYGAGPAKIGSIVGGGVAEGRELQRRFLSKFPAIAKLKAAIDNAIKYRGYLTGLDGRKLPIRSKHAALNTLLQSCGAVLMKQATCNIHHELANNRVNGVLQVAHIHDEIQLEVPEAKAELVSKLAVRAIETAGMPFGFRIRLDASCSIGSNWAETH